MRRTIACSHRIIARRYSGELAKAFDAAMSPAEECTAQAIASSFTDAKRTNVDQGALSIYGGQLMCRRRP